MQSNTETLAGYILAAIYIGVGLVCVAAVIFAIGFLGGILDEGINAIKAKLRR